jgi:hypothetical protein
MDVLFAEAMKSQTDDYLLVSGALGWILITYDEILN